MADSARKDRIRSRALELLDVAGYIPKPRLKQAMRIAARCENVDYAAAITGKASHEPGPAAQSDLSSQ